MLMPAAADVGAILARGEIQRNHRKARVGGMVLSTYTIDPASVDRMNRLTRRWAEVRCVKTDDGLDALVKTLLDGDE